MEALDLANPATTEEEIFQRDSEETQQWFRSDRFEETTRLYSARQVVEQRGSIPASYPIAQESAYAFFGKLRQLFSSGKAITTFGPYSPGQAVAQKRAGIEGIYLGGWATSAKGSIHEDPGPDLASYPLSQVPDDAAPIVRALLTADKNQTFLRSRMSEAERTATPRVDYRPFIIADADTGHGGEAHTRNLIRRFVEVGVPGYHIEDQKPGCKKCGHQGGKVLVSVQEQIMRLNAARFQLDIMRVPGIIVARTDSEAATLLEEQGDQRDQPFILGVTNRYIPAYKSASLAVLRRVYEQDVPEVNGHLLHAVSQAEWDAANQWFETKGIASAMDKLVAEYKENPAADLESMLSQVTRLFHEAWEADAGLMTYSTAVREFMETKLEEGGHFEMTPQEWHQFASTASPANAQAKARDMGINLFWESELARTPEGYYQILGGLDYAIARSLAVAPFADLLWMETKTADLDYARQFAEAIHAVYPDKMLAYNLSPSFNWDTTGMSDEEMRQFPEKLGKLGFVFNFITYGGHQIDGAAAEEFSYALRDDGMLALAKLQRKFRLLNSPYKTPQSLVGGPRADAALIAVSGRTATTKAMGKGSTQSQHLVQTEVPLSLLEHWLALWCDHHQVAPPLQVTLKPHRHGASLLELVVQEATGEDVAQIIFDTIEDRHGTMILSVRDQNTFQVSFRKKRLMTLLHLFLIHRYGIDSVHYVTPTEDNLKQTAGMKALAIYKTVNTEIGQIIVADVNREHLLTWFDGEHSAIQNLIVKDPQASSHLSSKTRENSVLTALT